ncbi:sodium/solute symporter [candidate division KSB1 bacterium]|nr:sodium/solute symporter [candidate division KSB1 bacterium]
MNDLDNFTMHYWDYSTFGLYFLFLSAIGFLAGRKEKENSSEYFLAGRTLPWYVVGSSFIAANISSEHFIAMVGAAFVYGICLATPEWSSLIAFSFLIWIFIPFLLTSRVFTTPEFLEKRFNSTIRHFFAVVTIIANIVAFLAAVLYGGGLAIHKLFDWNIWFSIVMLGSVAGIWAIYGGLKSVAWMDLLTIIIMVAGGLMVTVLGFYALSGDSHSLIEGFKVMIERNQGKTGVWAEAISRNIQYMVKGDSYNRLSVIQPITHQVIPWLHWVLSFFYVGLWYTVINQFMVQRVLGAKNIYHARMGIIFAGYLKLLLPFIVVVPGLIMFALKPEIMLMDWSKIRPAADTSYVVMLQMLVPIGLRGLFLAALFGAIQSTVSSVLNATATVFTIDFYKRLFKKDASDKSMVRVGIISTTIFLIVSIILAGFIARLQGSLFVYIQTLTNFFAPPFSAVFLLGSLWRRINGKGATAAVFSGFGLGIMIKIYIESFAHPAWIEPYANQGVIMWAFSMIVCAVVSILTAPPRPEQVTDDLTFNWKKMNIGDGLGDKWYKNVTFWWTIGMVLMFAFIFIFGVIL